MNRRDFLKSALSSFSSLLVPFGRKGSMVQHHRCATCKRNDVKLYRPAGEFLRDYRIFCRRHVPVDSWNWYVPLVEDDDGSVWGYTSVPEDHYERWDALPDVW